MSSQFIRLEPYSAAAVRRIVAEADREPEFCKHVAQPQKPRWFVGSSQSILDQVAAHMATSTPIKRRDDTLAQRKRRTDHRCLVAGVASWPDSIEWFSCSKDRERAAQVREWVNATIAWLQRRFDAALAGVVFHTDENYPHLHFFCAGDANDLHPGLRAEFEDGRRLSSKTEKQRRYKAAMRAFLDDYHAQVAGHFQLERHTGQSSTPRIKDRAAALRILRLEQRMRILGDAEGLAEIAAVRHQLEPLPRSSMRF
jgi:hypothetical protein